MTESPPSRASPGLGAGGGGWPGFDQDVGVLKFPTSGAALAARDKEIRTKASEGIIWVRCGVQERILQTLVIDYI